MTTTMPPQDFVNLDFAKRLDQTAEDTEALLAKLLDDTLLPDEITRPKRVMDAMRYSSLGGGKRLRPFLVVESSVIFGVPRGSALLAGAALESMPGSTAPECRTHGIHFHQFDGGRGGRIRTCDFLVPNQGYPANPLITE